jgi:hypothetical protein
MEVRMKIGRRYLVSAALLVVMLPLLGCPTDPDNIRTGVIQNLQPYFPNVQAYVEPAQGTIIGLTCTQDDIGPALVQKLQQQIATDQATLQKLALLRTLAGYRVFAVGFQHQIVRYDIGSGYVKVEPAPDDYRQFYQHHCGLQQSGRVAGAPNAFVWVGTFRIKLPGMPAFIGRHVLGLYGGDGEFEAHRDMEVAMRKQVLRNEYPEAEAIELVNIVRYSLKE